MPISHFGQLRWELATKLDALSTGPVLYKHSPKQIAIFRIDDQVFAVDNRCPHEGYPLVQGKVDDNCLLTGQVSVKRGHLFC